MLFTHSRFNFASERERVNAYLRWLCGHLDACLQDGDGELRVWTEAEPEPELRVRFLHLQLLHQLVQLRHPAEGQVAVCKEYPDTLQEREREISVTFISPAEGQVTVGQEYPVTLQEREMENKCYIYMSS
ncbi:hypothetical protein DPMN_185032 [Dreissena polymorpha]|uniref:Uncharacterized protein n=1 Tax=Dreissena polymorpha TaxID=45954 RepID=A0A9D4I556_DREPO|nr:hypothetical protein DPMN_185032 [Dreissena polymorpha]